LKHHPNQKTKDKNTQRLGGWGDSEKQKTPKYIKKRRKKKMKTEKRKGKKIKNAQEALAGKLWRKGGLHGKSVRERLNRSWEEGRSRLLHSGSKKWVRKRRKKRKQKEKGTEPSRKNSEKEQRKLGTLNVKRKKLGKDKNHKI